MGLENKMLAVRRVAAAEQAKRKRQAAEFAQHIADESTTMQHRSAAISKLSEALDRDERRFRVSWNREVHQILEVSPGCLFTRTT